MQAVSTDTLCDTDVCQHTIQKARCKLCTGWVPTPSGTKYPHEWLTLMPRPKALRPGVSHSHPVLALPSLSPFLAQSL